MSGTLLRAEASWRRLERKTTLSLPYHSHATNPDATTGMVIGRRQDSPPAGNIARGSKNENIGRKLNHKERIARPRIKFQRAQRGHSSQIAFKP
jgi:hypothetical protein